MSLHLCFREAISATLVGAAEVAAGGCSSLSVGGRWERGIEIQKSKALNLGRLRDNLTAQAGAAGAAAAAG